MGKVIGCGERSRVQAAFAVHGSRPEGGRSVLRPRVRVNCYSGVAGGAVARNLLAARGLRAGRRRRRFGLAAGRAPREVGLASSRSFRRMRGRPSDYAPPDA